jgi:hypothetical protein
MNNLQTKALYENFNSQLTKIEKDMAEIAEMAAAVSDKFDGIGNNILNFAALAGLGRKGQTTATIVGGAVKLFGGVYAELKKEEALKKLLPKKVELAELKTAVIQNFKGNLEGRKAELNSLLQQEVGIEFKEEDKSIRGEACQDAYAMYVRSMHIIEICNYMLEEFAAWKLGKHESGMPKPDKAVVLEEVVAMITTPENLTDPNNTKITGGLYLLSKNEPLFATMLNKIHSDASKSDNKEQKRVANRKSFTEVKKFVRKLKKIEKSKEITHLNWLNSFPTFQNAVETFKLTRFYTYLLKYYGIGYFIFILFMRSSMNHGAVDMILSAIMLSFIVSNIAIVFSLIIFYLYENEDGKGLWYYIFFLTFTVLTFGLMPIAFKRYLEKESNYEDFLTQLRVKINE